MTLRLQSPKLNGGQELSKRKSLDETHEAGPQQGTEEAGAEPLEELSNEQINAELLDAVERRRRGPKKSTRAIYGHWPISRTTRSESTSVSINSGSLPLASSF